MTNPNTPTPAPSPTTYDHEAYRRRVKIVGDALHKLGIYREETIALILHALRSEFTSSPASSNAPDSQPCGNRNGPATATTSPKDAGRAGVRGASVGLPEISFCPRCDGSGGYQSHPADAELVCSLCNGTGRLGPDGEPFVPSPPAPQEAKPATEHAFPSTNAIHAKTGIDAKGNPTLEHQFVHCSGMTLRDYFAAKAMQGFIAANKDIGNIHAPHVTCCAFYFADAMLTARKVAQNV